MRAIFDIGIEEGLLTRNPFAQIGRLKIDNPPPILPSTEEFFRIIRYIRERNAWCSRGCGDFIEFLAYSGLRKDEARRSSPARLPIEVIRPDASALVRIENSR